MHAYTPHTHLLLLSRFSFLLPPSAFASSFPFPFTNGTPLITYRWRNPKLCFSKKKRTSNSLQMIAQNILSLKWSIDGAFQKLTPSTFSPEYMMILVRWYSMIFVRWYMMIRVRWYMMILVRWYMMIFVRWYMMIFVRWYMMILVRWYMMILVRWYMMILVRWYMMIRVRWYMMILVRWYMMILVRWYMMILVRCKNVLLRVPKHPRILFCIYHGFNTSKHFIAPPIYLDGDWRDELALSINPVSLLKSAGAFRL